LRYFNVYGPRCAAGEYSGVMRNFARRASSGLPLEIFGDGNQTRDFVHVDDVAHSNAIVASSKAAVGRTLNIASGRKITIKRLAEIFLDEMGIGKRKIFYKPPRTGEIRDSWASIDEARETIGFRPTMEISVGVRKFIEWYAIGGAN
jgi:UDP-glucose 4-epimerase